MQNTFVFVIECEAMRTTACFSVVTRLCDIVRANKRVPCHDSFVMKVNGTPSCVRPGFTAVRSRWVRCEGTQTIACKATGFHSVCCRSGSASCAPYSHRLDRDGWEGAGLRCWGPPFQVQYRESVILAGKTYESEFWERRPRDL